MNKSNQIKFFITFFAFTLPLCTSGYFAVDFSLGMNHPEVRQLQSVLAHAGYPVTAPGQETTYFGAKTKAALAQFQVDNAAKILDGVGILGGNVRHVTIEDTEIANFYIGIHSQNQSGTVTNLTVRNSNIHHNSEHGMLGSADSLLLEGNVIADNNMDGGGFEHGIYLSGGNNVTVRNNTFTNNSAPGGVCNGGNLTWHGQADGALIEGNTITQVAATGGCYGFSITAAYSSPEWFRNVIMRNNTVRNVGFCAFCMSSAPNVLIENNRIFNTQATYQVGVLIPAIPPGAGDDVDTGAIIRNNTVCYSQPASGSGVVGGPSMASAASIIGNSYRTGADASTGACAP